MKHKYKIFPKKFQQLGSPSDQEIVAQLDQDALKTLQTVVNRTAASKGSSGAKEHNVKVRAAVYGTLVHSRLAINLIRKTVVLKIVLFVVDRC